MKRLLAALLVMVLLMGLMPVMGAQAAEYATVVGGWLRLREAPSFNAETLSSYYTGTSIQILGKTGNWYQVKTPDGRSGYMCADFLSFSGVTSKANATVVSGNGYGVRMRKGPSTSYGVIAKYPVGTRVEILQSSTYWCRIQVNGIVGYMMTQFLHKDGSVTPVYQGDAIVWSSNGYGVRLRTGPSKSYSKIGTYSIGTPVKILQKGDVWDYIQIGSRVGYMMNEFLIYNKDKSISSVTINNMNPVIGNILAMHTVKPTSASVTYEWMRKDASGNVTTVGTNPAYSVTAADAGCSLQLKVTGCGGYTGSAVSGYTAVVADSKKINGVELDNLSPVIGDKLTPSVKPKNATFECVWEVNGKTYTSDVYTVSEQDKGYTIKLTVKGTGAYEGSEKTVETSAVTVKGRLENVKIQNETSTAAAPNVGDKLTAKVTPATATVTYEWKVLRGETVVKTFTERSIIVNEDYEGCVIQLKVKANGSYEGEGSDVTPAVTNLTTLTGVTINGDAQPAVKKDSASTLTASVTPAGATAAYVWYADGAEVGTGESYTVTKADAGKKITVKASATGETRGSAESAATAAVAVQHTDYQAKGSGTNTVGYDYAVEFVGNGTEPTTWTITASIPGMSVSGNTISGKPTAAGEYSVQLKASNAAGKSALSNYTITIEPEQVKPTVTAPAEGTFHVGQSVGTLAFTATEAPITGWNMVGTLPEGLIFDTNTGAITGTPSAAGTYAIVVTAANKAGTSEGVSYTLKVVEDLSISGYNGSYTFESGADVEFAVTATGGSGSYVWSVSPADTFAVNGGKVTALNADLAEGAYPVTVTVTDAADATLTKTTETISVVVDAPDPETDPVAIQSEESYPFEADEPVTVTLTATGGAGSYDWSLLAEDETYEELFLIEDGVITAETQPAAGLYTLTVTAADKTDAANSASVIIIIEVKEEATEPGSTEGTGEGEGTGDGAGEETGEETGDGSTEGNGEGIGDGSTEGTGEETGDGSTEGTGEETGDGSTEGDGEGIGDGSTEGLSEGEETGDGSTEGE